MLIFIGVSKGHSQCILYDQETIRGDYGIEIKYFIVKQAINS